MKIQSFASVQGSFNETLLQQQENQIICSYIDQLLHRIPVPKEKRVSVVIGQSSNTMGSPVAGVL